MAGLLLLGGTGARAATTGRWEAILGGHLKTDQEALTIQAKAQSLGLKAVIQHIGPGNIEVEIINGQATKQAALAACAQAKPVGVRCSVEQEFHGIPAEWNTGTPGPTPTPTPTPKPVPSPGPAGWYNAPYNVDMPSCPRYWDGTQWAGYGCYQRVAGQSSVYFVFPANAASCDRWDVTRNAVYLGRVSGAACQA
jgi:hypothetical protein